MTVYAYTLEWAMSWFDLFLREQEGEREERQPGWHEAQSRGTGRRPEGGRREDHRGDH